MTEIKLDNFQESVPDSHDGQILHSSGVFRSPILYSSPPFIIGLSMLISYFPLQSWEISWFITMVIYSSLAVGLPFIACFLYRKISASIPALQNIIDLPEDQSKTWLAAQFRFIFNNPLAYIIGICLAIVGTLTTEALGLPWSGIARFLSLTFLAVLFGLTGLVGWYYFGLIRVIHNLNSLPIKGKPFDWPEISIRQLNSTYLQIFFSGVLIYIGFVSGVWISPGGQSLIFDDLLSQLWVFGAALIVIAFFLVSQVYIHDLIVNSKQRRLQQLNQMLANKFEEWSAEPSEVKSKAITDLIAWRNQIDNEIDWPLDFKSMLLVISGLLLPTVKTFIELVSR